MSQTPDITSDQPIVSEIISLNIGGTVFITTRSILTLTSGYFKSRLVGGMDPGFNADGALFVDRSGELFRHVLEYLRNLEEWYPPDDSKLLLDLVGEAQFYGLDGMVAAIKAVVKPYNPAFYIVLGKMHDIGYGSVTTTGAPKSAIDEISKWSKTPTIKDGQHVASMYDKQPSVGIVPRYAFAFQKEYKLMPMEEYSTSTTLYFVDKYWDNATYTQLRKKLGLACG